MKTVPRLASDISNDIQLLINYCSDLEVLRDNFAAVNGLNGL